MQLPSVFNALRDTVVPHLVKFCVKVLLHEESFEESMKQSEFRHFA
jgi:hypothetical protein